MQSISFRWMLVVSLTKQLVIIMYMQTGSLFLIAILMNFPENSGDSWRPIEDQ